MIDDDNPYQASAANAPLEARLPTTAEPDREFVQKVQFYLRLVGVLFLIDGIAGLAGGAVYWVTQSYIWRQAGYSPELDPYALMVLTTSGLMLIAGLYLVVGGQWVVEKIFLASPYRHFPGEESSEEAEGPAG